MLSSAIILYSCLLCKKKDNDHCLKKCNNKNSFITTALQQSGACSSHAPWYVLQDHFIAKVSFTVLLTFHLRTLLQVSDCEFSVSSWSHVNVGQSYHWLLLKSQMLQGMQQNCIACSLFWPDALSSFEKWQQTYYWSRVNMLSCHCCEWSNSCFKQFSKHPLHKQTTWFM